MPTFNVNMDAAIQFTAKLERLHRSAFPSAVRNTLNDAAFEAKRLVPKMADRQFTTRQRSFFRSFSIVDKAQGFNVNKMHSAVGINEQKGSRVAEGLKKQEKGGTIMGRKLIPHDKGRISGSHAKKLKRKHRFRNIGIGTSRRKATQKYVLIKSGAKGTVFERKGRRLMPVYVYRPHTRSLISASPFMGPAAITASRNMPNNYRRNAEFQFKKALQ